MEKQQKIISQLKEIFGNELNNEQLRTFLQLQEQLASLQTQLYKIQIKKMEEQRYLVSPEVWTSDVMEAKDFKSLLPLLDYQREYKLAGVEAFFWFDEPKYNFVLKVS